jgi:hypothetical protein
MTVFGRVAGSRGWVSLWLGIVEFQLMRYGSMSDDP